MDIEMFPPPGIAPFKKFKLASTGREVEPNFRKGGSVTVTDLAEELELIQEGWTLVATKATDHDDLRKIARRSGTIIAMPPSRSDADLRRSAAVAELRHAGHEVEAPSRIEFGEVDAGRHGRAVVSHDQGSDEIVVHGVTADLGDIDSNLRGAFRLASAAFLDAKQEADEQASAKALIGAVTAGILDRHDWLSAKVKEQKQGQRYG